MNTLIVGSSGKIGRYLLKQYNKRSAIFTYNKNKIKNGIKFDILKNNIKNIIKKKKIKKVIILSGISDPDNCFRYKKKSNNVNVVGMKKMINKIIKKNLYFIFFSTEFIYDGKKGNYSENNKAKPINVYGKQKYLIEKFINLNTKNCAIFRIAKTYGDNLNDKSFVSDIFIKLLDGKKNFNISTDQKFSPLFVKDLSRIIKIFLSKEIKGTYNVGGPEKYSRYSAFQKITNGLDSNIKKHIKINKSLLKKFNFADKRPLNVTFNIKKLKKVINFKMTGITAVASNIIKNNKLNEKIFN